MSGRDRVSSPVPHVTFSHGRTVRESDAEWQGAGVTEIPLGAFSDARV